MIVMEYRAILPEMPVPEARYSAITRAVAVTRLCSHSVWDYLGMILRGILSQGPSTEMAQCHLW